MKEKFFTSGQAAKMLGIAGRTVRRYLKVGKLHATQHPITKRWGLTQETIDNFNRHQDHEKAKERSFSDRRRREQRVFASIRKLSDDGLRNIELTIEMLQGPHPYPND